MSKKERNILKNAAIELRDAGYTAKADYTNGHITVDAPQAALDQIMQMITWKIHNITLVAA